MASELKYVCYKCGGEVPRNNNAALLDETVFWRTHVIVVRFGFPMDKQPSCHVLPVKNEAGEVVCPGSPSRSQYYPGMPRDNRPEFEYTERSQKLFDEGWKKLQEPPEDEMSISYP